MKRLMILLVALMVASVSFGENGPSPLVTPSSVSGLGTIATVDSPVPVANGGTGATTAAAGLAALGGASLNGSSTVDFNVRSLTQHMGTRTLVTTQHRATVANNATTAFTGVGTISASTGGILHVVVSGGNSTIFVISAETTSVIGNSATLSATKDAVGSINVYVESGVIYVQNKLGADRNLQLIFRGIP